MSTRLIFTSFTRHIWLLLIAVVASMAITLPASAAVSFVQLLGEAQLKLQLPKGFRPLPTQPNPLLDYEAAYGTTSGAVEVRYAVRPLQRVRRSYDRNQEDAPDPDYIFPLVFGTFVEQLAGGTRPPSREYPPGVAKDIFNADWAAAAVFDVDPRFGGRYRQAFFIAMHKYGVADAYVVFLFDDYGQVKETVQSALPALSFR